MGLLIAAYWSGEDAIRNWKRATLWLNYRACGNMNSTCWIGEYAPDRGDFSKDYGAILLNKFADSFR